MSYMICDIETGPQSIESLTARMPEFDPPGNLKDPEKIKAAIEVKKQKWIDDAALSAETGKIIAIGYKVNGELIARIDSEEQLLADFWKLFLDGIPENRKIVGHNFLGFDWPFILRRSWAVGINPPEESYGIGRYRYDPIVDTMLLWDVMGTRDFIGLSRLAQFLGVGSKTMSGADFAKLVETNREQAIEYLENDIKLTEAVFLKMRPQRLEEDCPY